MTDLLNTRTDFGAGKQSVYHVLQDAPQASSDDLSKIDDTTTLLREQIGELKANEKTQKAELVNLGGVTSIDSLQTKVVTLELLRDGLVIRVEVLKKIAVKPVNEKDKKAAEQALAMWKRHADARKRIIQDLWARWAEEYPAEEMGIDEEWVRYL